MPSARPTPVTSTTLLGWYGRAVSWKANRISDPVARLRYLNSAMARKRHLPAGRIAPALMVLALVPVVILVGASTGATVPLPPFPALAHAAEIQPTPVWLVEEKNGFEVYSNGLRIENQHRTHGRLRQYPAFDHRSEKPLEWRTRPSGIVYHTTESLLAPFEAGQNHTLQRLASELAVHVRRNHSYHFLIDRFGRVWRIVDESDAAHHAGRSVWADREHRYVNLNHAFLGISFETRTRSGTDQTPVNPAQVHAGRVLTEMLRSRYSIAGSNCVTHAQVSVNAGQKLVGYHTDWAADFPFAGLGLPNNYATPLPAIYAFGFQYDTLFAKATGDRLWQGLILAEERLRMDAAGSGTTLDHYRSSLQAKYRHMTEASEEAEAHKENH